MKKALLLATATILLAFLGLPVGETQAHFDTSSQSTWSPRFGYGAHIEIRSPADAAETTQAAAGLGLDWLAVDFNWAAAVKNPDSIPDFSILDSTMQVAVERQVPVMVSLRSIPKWALTSEGPAPKFTLSILSTLIQRYPQSVKAIELYPSANTRDGWGVQPDPGAYASLFKVVRAHLNKMPTRPVLIAAGLEYLSVENNKAESDTDFLPGFLNNISPEELEVISLNLGQVSSSPAVSPMNNSFALRRYEKIRNILVENGFESSVIWVTHLQPPSGKIRDGDAQFTAPEAQSAWMVEAITQIRSQLYINVVFIDGFTSSQSVPFSLVAHDQPRHPFYSSLKQLITQNNPEGSLKKGRPKSSNLVKKRT